MNTRTFARLLAKRINDNGDAVHAVARQQQKNGWRIVDAGSVGNELLWDCIRWVRSQEEYRVGKVDVFRAITRSNHSKYFYVGPCGYIE